MHKQIMSAPECRLQAQRCRSWAKAAISQEAKDGFNSAAQAWTMLAVRYEKNSKPANDAISRGPDVGQH